jgi:hypothetical protein
MSLMADRIDWNTWLPATMPSRIFPEGISPEHQEVFWHVMQRLTSATWTVTDMDDPSAEGVWVWHVRTMGFLCHHGGDAVWHSCEHIEAVTRMMRVCGFRTPDQAIEDRINGMGLMISIVVLTPLAAFAMWSVVKFLQFWGWLG